jgi:hypothetical protein
MSPVKGKKTAKNEERRWQDVVLKRCYCEYRQSQHLTLKERCQQYAQASACFYIRYLDAGLAWANLDEGFPLQVEGQVLKCSIASGSIFSNHEKEHDNLFPEFGRAGVRPFEFRCSAFGSQSDMLCHSWYLVFVAQSQGQSHFCWFLVMLDD